MHYVYFLKSTSSRWIYIGTTNNLGRRLREHNNGKSAFTSRKGPWNLVYFEAYKDERDAIAREKSLKKYGSGLGQLRKRLFHSLGMK